ncbi:MAG: hypothetical protein GTO45_24685 [Candidatus Aminicenantes bacterium]|nr:hypothetical protein [Candidatus Aminicenantes bacterium]NIM81953.1 hypothetical protein [Candidatus Aminicenantes bacterium]NIN21329.1 hypothetical protein [Candidatus Aminicenantes bacterium]NIN45150.1 hypothetical protein [Candidatus Aminicenantes bacterium]NIN87967.1 hypothetical protein [Candidatus Aminicenantes bacterium]
MKKLIIANLCLLLLLVFTYCNESSSQETVAVKKDVTAKQDVKSEKLKTATSLFHKKKKLSQEKRKTAYEVNVDLTDSNGMKTKVSNLKAYMKDSCKGMMYYLGVATKTEFSWDFIPIDTGDYIVNVPFEIIQKIKVEKKKDPKKTWRINYIYNLFLSDGSVIKGETKRITEFKGDTDLGKFSVSKANVKEILFNHTPALNFNAELKGKKNAVLELSDKSQLSLEGASFVKDVKNRNGCFLRETFPNEMIFDTGASQYTIVWDKIASIVFQKLEKSYEKKFKLISKNGNEYLGTARELTGIQGAAVIGGFKLRLTIPFNSKALRVIF